jgi:hypothetical protein
MSKSKKYKSFGVRRTNNLSDLQNKETALNNLLDDFPGVDPANNITFVSEDLNAIRGLKDTSVTPGKFAELIGLTPVVTQLITVKRILSESAAIGDTVLQLVSTIGLQIDQTVSFQTAIPEDTFAISIAENSITISQPITSAIPAGSEISFSSFGNASISPIIKFDDQIKLYRDITENPPVFPSGQGPRAYFIPSNLIPSFTKTTKIQDNLQSSLTDPNVQTSNDYWMLGEFAVTDKIRVDFADSYGGVLWEGYYIPNTSASQQTFLYETSGLFHVEYDRFSNGNWEVLKSIYAKKRSVTVASSSTGSTLSLAPGDGKYVSINDFLENNINVRVVSIQGDTVGLSSSISVSENDVLVFDMNLGSSAVSGSYNINDILDRGETPQIRKRLFWWFPFSVDYEPTLKYLRNRIQDSNTYDFYFLNKDPADTTPAQDSIRNLLNNALTPSQQNLGSSANYRQLKSTNSSESIYIPKSSLSQIQKSAVNISFSQGSRSASGNFAGTELGNVIVPTAIADLGTVIPKDLRIKSLLGSSVSSNVRIVSQQLAASRSGYSVRIIDHNGLIDYFAATSSGTTVTVADTAGLRKDLICITASTANNAFVRISSIVSSTEFTTTAPLNLSNEYVYVYANAGILDTSLDNFCVGVFGKILTSTASSGASTLTLNSVAGIETNQVVQYGDSIPANTVVSSIDVGTNTVTLSNSLLATVNQDETVVFAPAGTDVNKEICVLPLDLSPPFIGVDTGLDTNSKSIKSTQADFNLKVRSLEFRNTVANTIDVSLIENEDYNRKIKIKNSNFHILAKKL